MASIVLTTPQGGGGGISGTTSPTIIIPYTAPNNIQIVDSYPCINNSTVKWIYTIKSPTFDAILTAEILGMYRNGQDPTHTRYSIIGDTNILIHKADVIVDAGELALQITNMSSLLPDVNKHIEYYINIIRIQTG